MNQPDKTNKVLGYLLGGLVIGPILAVGCPFLGVVVGGSASTQSNDYSDTPIAIGIIAGLLLPLLIPVPLLFRPATRPWGVGILIGAALTMIVLGGICAGFIYLLSQESA
ncbi:hypothetical protein [Nocardioides sp. MH1]|uniref:hypothetical protein n=1 Tax=Nocardioides sp. MH1 TaxID=3242490 RepID=UPI00352255BB